MLTVQVLDELDAVEDAGAYRLLSVTERDMRAGEWYLELPLASPGARALRGVDWPGIEVYNPEDDTRFGGFVTRRGVRSNADTGPVAWFRGLDFQAWMNGWLAWPNPLDVNDFWQPVGTSGNLSLTSSMHNQAGLSFGFAATADRQMPGVAGITVNDPDAGPAPAWTVEAQPTLDLFRGWCTGTDYTFRLRLNRPSVGGGELLFETPARGTIDEPFDIVNGSYAGYDASEVAALASRAIAMGAEDDDPGAAAGERFVSDQKVTPTDWRSRYWEVFRDRFGLDQTQLDSETGDWLAELSDTESIDVSDAIVSGYGQRFTLGDYVDVKLDDDTTITTTVAATTIRADGGSDPVRTLSFGSEALGVEELMLERMTRLASRIVALERLGG